MKKDIQKICDFMSVLNALCLVKRDNLLTNGQHESDTDHTFKLGFLIMAIAPYLKTPCDVLKMQQMALVHDLAEAKTKDYSYASTVANSDMKAAKKQAESAAFEEYRQSLPSALGNQISALFQEFEARETFEAKVVYALDRMEATLQSNQHKDGDIRYWANYANGDFYYTNAIKTHDWVKDLDEQVLNDLEQAIIQLSAQNIQKCKIVLKNGEKLYLNVKERG